jgi:hypothetical protein
MADRQIRIRTGAVHVCQTVSFSVPRQRGFIVWGLRKVVARTPRGYVFVTRIKTVDERSVKWESFEGLMEIEQRAMCTPQAHFIEIATYSFVKAATTWQHSPDLHHSSTRRTRPSYPTNQPDNDNPVWSRDPPKYRDSSSRRMRETLETQWEANDYFSWPE